MPVPQVFSQRYSQLLSQESFQTWFNPNFCDAIFILVMNFNEPELIFPDRYNSSYSVTILAFTKASENLFKIYNYPIDKIDIIDGEWLFKQGYHVILDYLELWYLQLSPNEQHAFQIEVNSLFDEYSYPWRMANGRFIRIDPTQFERDLEIKYLETLQDKVSEVPAFQNALNEYLQAIENFEKGKYKDTLFYAENSYESVLKIVCQVEKGTASQLTQAYIGSVFSDDLPSSMKRTGFQTNVLMSLPFIRNSSNAGHGDGLADIIISPSLAKLALNLCASLCTYAIEVYLARYGEKIE